MAETTHNDDDQKMNEILLPTESRVRQLQDELRRSLSPVSSFFLLTSTDSLHVMIEKLQSLRDFGIGAEQIHEIARIADDVLQRFTPCDEFEIRRVLQFRVEDELRYGDVSIRNAPGHGFEVELVLPGIVADRAEGFLENGFRTAFMPPSFYD